MSKFRRPEISKEPKIVNINSIHSKTLNRSMCVPSLVDSYSICIAYMKSWILDKFHPDTFKTVHIDGKHVYDDLRKFSKTELLKRPLPALTITPAIDWGFNNDHLDTYPFGLTMYTTNSRFNDSFFKDYSNNAYIGLGMESILMPFSFRFRVESRAQQIDMYNHVKKACRVGFTEGKDVDVDFNIPYEIIIQLAEDIGFKVEETANGIKRVSDIGDFLTYLNMHSMLPFVYKYRNINGNNEFYIRMSDMYIHIRPMDLSVDDGEREGHLGNNYNIELSCEVRFPIPKFYAYYSENDHRLQTLYSARPVHDDFNVRTFYQFNPTEIKDVNERGWNLMLTTSYDDNDAYENKDHLNIDFEELFKGDMRIAIDECLKQNISPSIFLDMRLVNDANLIQYTMDWSTFKLESNEVITHPITYIGLYCDNDFMHDMVEGKKNSKMNRIDISK